MGTAQGNGHNAWRWGESETGTTTGKIAREGWWGATRLLFTLINGVFLIILCSEIITLYGVFLLH